MSDGLLKISCRVLLSFQTSWRIRTDKLQIIYFSLSLTKLEIHMLEHIKVLCIHLTILGHRPLWEPNIFRHVTVAYCTLCSMFSCRNIFKSNRTFFSTYIGLPIANCFWYSVSRRFLSLVWCLNIYQI